MTNELNDAVKRIAELEPNRISVATIHYQNIITQQAAIIEQQREEIAALNAVVFEPCCATEATIQKQREALGIAREALTPFNDAFVEANKYVLQGVPLDEDTASSVWVGCINEVSVNDFKQAARACKALAAIDNVMKGA